MTKIVKLTDQSSHPATVTTERKFKQLWNMVGNTPLVAVHYTYKGEQRTIYVKCEHYNLTGSIKDRMALYILEKSYQLGLIRKGDTIVEATSGNTGISFSALGKALNHHVKIIMTDWLSKERIAIIRSLGAEVILVSKEQGGFIGSIGLSQTMFNQNNNTFLPCQFENGYNSEAHEKTTAPEIWKQLQSIDKIPDAFVAGVGTGGTVMGVGKYLKEKNPSVRIHPLEPLESPTLSTGFKVGSHRIQGISDEFIPSIVKLSELDRVLQASDGDAILMAQKISQQLGLAVGISSGANIIGAIQLQNELGRNSTVVTVFSDSNKKYLSTDLMRNEPALSGYYSNDVDFLCFESLGRVHQDHR